MPRFYISDSNRPGIRVPLAEYRKSDGTRQSDILNEAQAIARGRKNDLTASSVATYKRWRVRAVGSITNPAGASPKVWIVTELRMFDGSNVNLPTTVSGNRIASGPEGWGSITYINDGVLSGNQGWGSPQHVDGDVTGEWVGYDFFTARFVQRIIVYPYSVNNNYSVATLVVDGSNDGGLTWVPVRTFTGLPTNGTPQVLTLSSGYLHPVGYATSGNYNGPYDAVNGVDPSTGAYTVFSLTDGDAASEPGAWLTARQGQASPHWAVYDFGSTQPITGYKIRHFSGHIAQYVPRRWRFEGAASLAGPWTVLDNKTGSDHVWSAPNEYTANVTGSFRYVRLYIPGHTAGGGDCFSVGELEVFGG